MDGDAITSIQTIGIALYTLKKEKKKLMYTYKEQAWLLSVSSEDCIGSK